MFDIDVTKRGPLFDGRASAAVPAFIEVAVGAVADEGRNMARGMAPRRSGYYQSRITTERRGRDAVVTDGRVVYGPWLEGTSSRNQSTRFKGYRTFRQTTQRLQRRASDVAERSLPPFLKRMGG